MKLLAIFKSKILVSSIGAFTIAVSNSFFYEETGFSFSLLIIGFLAVYFFLWGYDNSEDDISN